MTTEIVCAQIRLIQLGCNVTAVTKDNNLVQCSIFSRPFGEMETIGAETPRLLKSIGHGN